MKCPTNDILSLILHTHLQLNKTKTLKDTYILIKFYFKKIFLNLFLH